MSSYKTTIRASQQPPDQGQPENSKYRAQAKQLQELFPTWSIDDLQTLLTEVSGDVELAATRISEGHAEQWGSVTRKKDKKVPHSPAYGQAKDSAHPSTRGGRGGRGARGGLSGRGGSTTRGRGGPPRGGSNGHIGRTGSPRINSPAPPQSAAAAPATDAIPESDVKAKAALDAPNGETSNGWAAGAESSSANAWNGAPPDSAPHTNGSALPPSAPHHVVAPKPTKTPANSKLSWAQIARQQEKPTPPPAPIPAPAPPQQTATPVEQKSTPAPVPAPEPEAIPQREEPTTVQPPTWEDEPPSKPPAAEPAPEVWPSSTAEDAQPEPAEEPEPEPEVAPEPIPEPKVEPTPKPQPQQPPSALPAQLLQQHKDLYQPTLPSTPAAPVATVATPSPKPSQARPSSAAHRASARYKIGEQPAVVMPSSFAGVEKVGMQFGSLNLGGDNLDATPTEPNAPEPIPAPSPIVAPVTAEPEPTPAPAPVQAPSEPPVPPTAPSAPPAPSAPTPTSISSSALFQPSLAPRQSPPQPPASQPSQLTTSVSQPITSSAQVSASHPPVSGIAAPPAQPYPQSQSQSSIAHHLQQQQHSLPQQIQQQANIQQQHQQHQYSQHALSAHADAQANQLQQQQLQHSQHQPQTAAAVAASAASGHNYFRGAADPFFHTPTPPAPQTQDSTYGAFGQQLGQMQAQATHLAGFSGDYGYGDNQRGFYDSYGQQTGFSNRNALGHDDMKGVPGGQQQPANSVGLSASATQASQHAAASQASAQPQAAAGQAPQQGYPPPLPYYYQPYPQNQFYGSPYNSGYGVPNYVKYPAMFAGAPAPASAPSPATKQPGNVQPQSNPYGQGLYTQHQQHPSASYDEISYQHHTQQHQPHGLGAGLPSNDYGKQLYGGQGGFMGLGQSTGPSGGVRNASGGSPETPYKPYAPKDVSGGVGSGIGVGQAMQGGRAGSVQGQQPNQGQTQGQGQPQQGQGSYYNNRYGGNAGAGVGGGVGVGGPQGQAGHHLHQPQGQAPQSHLGYPQAGTDGSFYTYQARQQGYWPQ